MALMETGVIDANLKPIKTPQNKKTNYIKQKQK